MKSSPDASSFTIGLVTFIFFFSFISSFFNSVLTVRGQQMGRDSYLTLKIEPSLPFFSPSDLLSGGEIRFSCSPCSGKRVSPGSRSEEHTSEPQSRGHLVCRLLLEQKKEAMYT